MSSPESLITAFSGLLDVPISDETRFGSASLKIFGICDGAKGVQWNTSMDLRDNSAHFAINLEGMKYDGWPVARFIEREFRYPRLLQVAKQIAEPERVHLFFNRNAWQAASSPSIQERAIGASGRSLKELTSEQWKATLGEAYQCLDPDSGYRNRARQLVTVGQKQVQLQVSPHFQISTAISDGSEGQVDWAPRIRAAKSALQPLYDYLAERCRP